MFDIQGYVYFFKICVQITGVLKVQHFYIQGVSRKG